jgi:ribosomal protein S18 acetylase RimI-like enzyme
MLTVSVRERGKAGGLRLMDPGRDLRQVADLIEEAFAGEIGPAGLTALRDLRLMSYLGSFVWLVDLVSGEFRDSFTGFVWVEDGRIVGNATLSRVAPHSTRWHISNVAVKESYRRRGIGRQLVEAVIDLARARGGEWAVLQVREDNPTAVRLYQRLGFAPLFTTVELELPGLDRPAEAPALPIGYRLGPCRPAQWRREYELAMQTTGPLERWLRGMEIADFRRPLGRRLSDWINNFLAGGHTWRLCLERDGELAASLLARARSWSEYSSIALRVGSAHRGLVERFLTRHALHLLAAWADGPIHAEVSAEHPEAVAALREAGFIERRRLVAMRLPLGTGSRPQPPDIL